MLKHELQQLTFAKQKTLAAGRSHQLAAGSRPDWHAGKRAATPWSFWLAGGAKLRPLWHDRPIEPLAEIRRVRIAEGHQRIGADETGQRYPVNQVRRGLHVIGQPGKPAHGELKGAIGLNRRRAQRGRGRAGSVGHEVARGKVSRLARAGRQTHQPAGKVEVQISEPNPPVEEQLNLETVGLGAGTK